MLLTTLLLSASAAPDTTAAVAPAFHPTVYEPQQRRTQPGRGESEHMLSWRFVEVHAQLRDVDAVDDDLNGFGGRAAWTITNGFFLRGGLDLYSHDDADLTRYDAGIGQAVPLQNGLDVFASLSWVWLQLDPDGGPDADEDGWRADVGLRGALDAKFESEARFGYEDVADDGFVWGLDVRYWFVPQVALGIGFEREVDDDVWTLGLRYAF